MAVLAKRNGLVGLASVDAKGVAAAERIVPCADPLLAIKPSCDLQCVIVAGALDYGGIERVVAALARGLPSQGIHTQVVCYPGGRVADELRREGVSTLEIPRTQLAQTIRALGPDIVQLHRVDAELICSLRAAEVTTVPIFHAVETYLDHRTWRELRALVSENSVAIAVSSNVREFFKTKLSESAKIRVVVNGTDLSNSIRESDRLIARRRLEGFLKADLSDDRVVVSLLRFSDQKNASGLVAAFLLACREAPNLRLIVAGSPDSWLEYRKADLVRRMHRLGDRVHLIGNSNAPTLLAAADVFALDSFAEGGPLAAVEAAAFGIPIVLADVGFARELISVDDVQGVVVPRASRMLTQSSIAQQRRRIHQSNIAEFAAGIVRASALEVRQSVVPVAFRNETMVAAHAEVLRGTAASARHRPRPSAGR